MSNGSTSKDNDILTPGLPVKITGIVFWGMVLVGLLIAVVVLKGRENELGARNFNEAKLLARELTEHIEEHHLASGGLSNSRSRLLGVIETLRPGLHFEAVELRRGSDVLLIGAKHTEQESISQIL